LAKSNPLFPLYQIANGERGKGLDAKTAFAILTRTNGSDGKIPRRTPKARVLARLAAPRQLGGFLLAEWSLKSEYLIEDKKLKKL
jgi:hypothetical protein